jgi:hypothetical protein
VRTQPAQHRLPSAVGSDPELSDWVALFGGLEAREALRRNPVDELREGYREWFNRTLTAPAYQCETLTFAPIDGRSITPTAAALTFGEYRKRVNRKVYGRACGRGQALQSIGFLEGGVGQGHKHLHIHALSEVPATIDPVDFRNLSQDAWRRLGWASMFQNVFTACTDLPGWIDYVVKDASKSDYPNSLILEGLSLDRNDERRASSSGQ